MKFKARILGMNGVSGFDSIGLVLMNYLGSSSDKLASFKSESVYCETNYNDLTIGDLIIIVNKIYSRTALAYAEEFFSEEIQDSIPQYDVLARLDVDKSYNSRIIEFEKSEILDQIKALLTILGLETIKVSDGKISIDTSEIEVTNEISELVERYNSL